MASKDDDSLLLKFLAKAFLVSNGTRLSGPLSNLGRPLEIELYVEPSLSEFGNPDAVILIKGTTGRRAAIYVEAKLCPFLNSSQEIKKDKDEDMYRKNASTLIHELYMKASFHEELQNKKEVHGLAAKVYIGESKSRKLGKDSQVIDLAKRLADCEQYFLALTTDPSRKVSETMAIQVEDPFVDHIESYWLSWSAKVRKLAAAIKKINHPPSPISKGGLDFTDPNFGTALEAASKEMKREPYYKNLYHLSWTDIFHTAKQNSQAELLEAIEENRSKLTFPVVSLPKDKNEQKNHGGECLRAVPSIVSELDSFWSRHNLKRQDRDSSARWTLKGGKKAFGKAPGGRCRKCREQSLVIRSENG